MWMNLGCEAATFHVLKIKCINRIGIIKKDYPAITSATLKLLYLVFIHIVKMKNKKYGQWERKNKEAWKNWPINRSLSIPISLGIWTLRLLDSVNNAEHVSSYNNAALHCCAVAAKMSSFGIFFSFQDFLFLYNLIGSRGEKMIYSDGGNSSRVKRIWRMHQFQLRAINNCCFESSFNGTCYHLLMNWSYR